MNLFEFWPLTFTITAIFFNNENVLFCCVMFEAIINRHTVCNINSAKFKSFMNFRTPFICKANQIFHKYFYFNIQYCIKTFLKPTKSFISIKKHKMLHTFRHILNISLLKPFFLPKYYKN